MSARSVALDVIIEVAERDAYANLLLPGRIAAAAISSADAALATELTYGTLRWQGQYDRVIRHLSSRDVSDLDADVAAALRLGMHQIARTRIADHAAVHESVDLLGRNARGKRGFVNALLRKCVDGGYAAVLRTILAEAEGDDAIALEHAHPSWIIRAFRRALAAEAHEDELLRLLESNNTPAGVQLVALPGLATASELGGSTTVSPIGMSLDRGDPAAHPLVKSGRARVQDAGSQLAAMALVEAQRVQGGERWLDMCAEPGGKAALLAAAAEVHGIELIANELQPHRAKLVQRATERFGTRVVTGDGRRFAQEPEAFDRVMVDAPCTGLGALRRRPESRWRKRASDIATLSALQEELLEAAIKTVKPGGIVAYVTCSPHLAETQQIVQRAVRSGEVETIETGSIMERIAPGIPECSRGTAAQLWPHRHGTDAMFVQLLRRV